MSERSLIRRKAAPAEVRVAGGGLDLEDALLDGQDADVEGAAAQGLTLVHFLAQSEQFLTQNTP